MDQQPQYTGEIIDVATPPKTGGYYFMGTTAESVIQQSLRRVGRLPEIVYKFSGPISTVFYAQITKEEFDNDNSRGWARKGRQVDAD